MPQIIPDPSAPLHQPGPIGIEKACEAIMSGDMNLARAELGFSGYVLADWQADELRWALQVAARKFNAPDLASRDVLAL